MVETRLFSDELTDLAGEVGRALVNRDQKVAVAESSAGGLISATLLTVPGASAFYLGGAVVYTSSSRHLLFEKDQLPADTRGATEGFVQHLCLGAQREMKADWGLAETGATGPSGNPYGDPAGHAWVGIARPDGTTAARHVLTGSGDRVGNMGQFTAAALTLLLDQLRQPDQTKP
jgi:nicotinamide-nucleotide amidase